MACFIGTAALRAAPAVAGAGLARTSPAPRVALVSRRAVIPLSMTATPQVVKRITVTGNNIDLTDSLRNYVVEKIGRVVNKHQQFVTHVDVHLTVARNPAIKHGDSAEVVVQVKGNVLRAEVKSEGMYGSIDMVADKLARTLRKYKERHTIRNGPKTASFVEGVETESEEDADDMGANTAPFEDENGVPRVTEVLKRKSFPMPLQTVEEAVLCLEYIDHSFYVFRNAETKEVNVVYKRNHGGVGLIEPKQ